MIEQIAPGVAGGIFAERLEVAEPSHDRWGAGISEAEVSISVGYKRKKRVGYTVSLDVVSGRKKQRTRRW